MIDYLALYRGENNAHDDEYNPDIDSEVYFGYFFAEWVRKVDGGPTAKKQYLTDAARHIERRMMEDEACYTICKEKAAKAGHGIAQVAVVAEFL